MIARRLLYAAAALALLAGQALAQDTPQISAGPAEIPDQALTPGEFASADQRDICGKVGGLTYSKRHRISQNEQTKREVMERYGVPWLERWKYEDDHDVPLCAGGSDSVSNRWPQPRRYDTDDNPIDWGPASPLWTAEDKDKLEAETCRQLCGSHEISVDEAHRRFTAPSHWPDAYCQLFDDPRCAR